MEFELMLFQQVLRNYRSKENSIRRWYISITKNVHCVYLTM